MVLKVVQVSWLTFSRSRLTFSLTFFRFEKVSLLTFYDHPIAVGVAATLLAPLDIEMAAGFEPVQEAHRGGLGHADRRGEVFA